MSFGPVCLIAGESKAGAAGHRARTMAERKPGLAKTELRTLLFT